MRTLVLGIGHYWFEKKKEGAQYSSTGLIQVG